MELHMICASLPQGLRAKYRDATGKRHVQMAWAPLTPAPLYGRRDQTQNMFFSPRFLFSSYIFSASSLLRILSGELRIR